MRPDRRMVAADHRPEAGDAGKPPGAGQVQSGEGQLEGAGHFQLGRSVVLNGSKADIGGVTGAAGQSHRLLCTVLNAAGVPTNDWNGGTELAELKALCKERELATKGSKAILIKRLQKSDEPF